VNPLRAVLSPTWPEADSDGDAPVVLLLHGYGSHEDDLPGLAHWLPAGVTWASLRAPIDMQYGGAAWFPLDLPDEPDAELVDSATDAIWQWVDAHVPASAPLVPLGFSQGGSMALQMLRTRPERVAATVVLSGFVARATQPADAVLAQSRPPVFWGRGVLDTVIWSGLVADLEAWLPAHSTPTIREYQGLGHGVRGDEMDEVRAFIMTQLGAHHA